MLVTKSNLEAVLKEIASTKVIACDLETTGLNPWQCGEQRDRIAGIAVSVNGEGRAFYLPLFHQRTENLDAFQSDIVKALEKPHVIINHNLKFDMNFLNKIGMNTTKPLWIDTQNGAYLLDECNTKALKPLADRYLSSDSSEESKRLMNNIHQSGFDGKGDIWKLPAADVVDYGEMDTKLAWGLWRYFCSTMPSGLQELWKELNELSKAAHTMEINGTPVGLEALEQVTEDARMQSIRLLIQIKNMYPMLDPDSPASIARVFKIPNAKKDTIDAEIANIPELKIVQKYRKLTKMLSTYLNPYKKDFICDDLRIRPTFNMLGTRSGRWSSNRPNLQQIPRKSDEQKVKNVFNTSGDSVFVEFDYSQAEIRLAAYYAQDSALIEAIRQGEDIHSYTAKQAFGDVTKEKRQFAKTINFAVVYGAGVDVVAQKLGTTKSKAQEFLNKYHQRFHYQKAIDAAKRYAEKKLAIRMWNGRLRHYSHPSESSHTAFNQLIQGGVGQMVNRVVVRLMNELPEAKMIMQVHDAVYFEMHRDQVEKLTPEIKRIMQDQPQFNVPFTVDCKVGTCMGEMKDYEVK
jgi:DNA polymerase-1